MLGPNTRHDRKREQTRRRQDLTTMNSQTGWPSTRCFRLSLSFAMTRKRNAPAMDKCGPEADLDRFVFPLRETPSHALRGRSRSRGREAKEECKTQRSGDREIIATQEKGSLVGPAVGNKDRTSRGPAQTRQISSSFDRPVNPALPFFSPRCFCAISLCLLAIFASSRHTVFSSTSSFVVCRHLVLSSFISRIAMSRPSA